MGLLARLIERTEIALFNAHRFYGRHLRPGDLVFDIGANIGDHAAAMAEAGATVVAVEPQPDLAEHIALRLPAVTVLQCGVGEAPGTARLLMSSSHKEIATLNPDWRAEMAGFGWDGEQEIEITTLGALVKEFGVPRLVKLDVEGVEDRALRTLSEPVAHVLFEIHAALPDVAGRAFAEMSRLGEYEYRLAERESWRFGRSRTETAILAAPPVYGNVWARLNSRASAAPG